MKKAFLLLLPLLMFSCGGEKFSITLTSPKEVVSVQLFENSESQLAYIMNFQGNPVLLESTLGLELREYGLLGKEMELLRVDSTRNTRPWNPLWGEDGIIIDDHKAYTFYFRSKKNDLLMNVHFKLFADGMGFKYEFPPQEGVDELIIDDEFSQFKLTGDHTAWWIPADYDSYEHLYKTTKVSEIDSSLVDSSLLAASTIMERHAVNTPLTMQTASGLHISIHEASLTNYSEMTLRVEDDKRTLTSSLVPSQLNGWKAKVNAPFSTPWRTVQVAEKAGGLIESKLIVNLNEPNKLENTDWIKPGKYIGIWWEMHLQTSSWDMASGKHGATTEKAKRYIDFAAKHGFDGVLVEGWNTGWERWIGFPDREGVFDFVTPYPDYNLEEVVAYGKQKGVEIIMHHETSAAPRTYEQQLDTAYALMQNLGIHAVKTGYVGPIIPEGEYHHGQWMVNHYRKVLSKAAQSEVMVFAHEPIKATGLRRTYPNMMAREGLRGSEFNSPWGGGNPPEHLTIVPFTRMLGGPIDYTPGLFKLNLNEYKEGAYVPTTLAHQLAEYVVVYSPVQMAPDLIEHYEGEAAFQFIKDVPTDWDASKVLAAEIGEYIVMARLGKNEFDWYLGGLTDENARELEVSLDFLQNGAQYEAQIYKDAADADFETNQAAYEIEKRIVTKKDKLTLKMARGGGVAVRFKAL
ncbi:alpha-glucosidase [Roseivirga spongicola]|uniref:Alpha-glucosidase n=1 Tax=Roseivirga spongicola TaxID=333140 RepID=A0A150XG85_9BACT|nr:glycoside hydrolase family 97 protein [Roseivirga spongicola]KYG77727.1 alpha-glucosidase [Roseivirga spongicola]